MKFSYNFCKERFDDPSRDMYISVIYIYCINILMLANVVRSRHLYATENDKKATHTLVALFQIT